MEAVECDDRIISGREAWQFHLESVMTGRIKENFMEVIEDD